MAEKIKNAAVVLAAALFIFGFFAWNLLKPAQAESLSERRPLAQLPAADAEAVLSGDFMENFETYALDQFPLRDGFRAVKACVSLYALGQGGQQRHLRAGRVCRKARLPDGHGVDRLRRGALPVCVRPVSGGAGKRRVLRADPR